MSLVVGQRWRFAEAAEARQIEIVDDLADQLVETFHQLHPGVGVTGHTQRRQDDIAELVDGRDGGGVETGEGITEQFLARREYVRAAVQQVSHHLVLPRQSGIVEGRQGVGDLAAHPVP